MEAKPLSVYQFQSLAAGPGNIRGAADQMQNQRRSCEDSEIGEGSFENASTKIRLSIM